MAESGVSLDGVDVSTNYKASLSEIVATRVTNAPVIVARGVRNVIFPGNRVVEAEVGVNLEDRKTVKIGGPVIASRSDWNDQSATLVIKLKVTECFGFPVCTCPGPASATFDNQAGNQSWLRPGCNIEKAQLHTNISTSIIGFSSETDQDILTTIHRMEVARKPGDLEFADSNRGHAIILELCNIERVCLKEGHEECIFVVKADCGKD